VESLCGKLLLFVNNFLLENDVRGRRRRGGRGEDEKRKQKNKMPGQPSGRGLFFGFAPSWGSPLRGDAEDRNVQIRCPADLCWGKKIAEKKPLGGSLAAFLYGQESDQSAQLPIRDVPLSLHPESKKPLLVRFVSF